MTRVIVIYESKYGNTKLVAETIAEGIRGVEGVEASVKDIKNTDLSQIGEFDAILIGSPNHIGRAAKGIREFIDNLGELNLEGKWAAAFDTYLGNDFEKAVKKMEKQISEKVPNLKLAAPGLSIRVNRMKGPIAEGEISKCKEFGNKVATLIRMGD